MTRTSTTPITLVQQDWSRFLTPDGLAEKAGVPPRLFMTMMMKELADNAADTGGAEMHIIDDDSVRIGDTGDGFPTDDVPTIFSVKRPLTSSKHWRRGERGALGNGLRAVMGALHVLDGTMTIESRGIATSVKVDDNGDTIVTATDPSPVATGTQITVNVPGIAGHCVAAAWAIALPGRVIDGRPSPRWFSLSAIRDLQRSADGVSLGDFVGQFATTYAPPDPQRLVTDVDAEDLLHQLTDQAERVPKINPLGRDVPALGGEYAIVTGSAYMDGAVIPYVVEVWAYASRMAGEQELSTTLLMNRAFALGNQEIEIGPKGRLSGIFSGYRYNPSREQRDSQTLKRTVDFNFVIALSCPHIPIITSGKAPNLAAFQSAIFEAVAKAGRKAQKNVTRAWSGTSIKDAVYQLLPAAYEAVSEGGRYWANVRQLMYAIRPDILTLTGKETVGDKYITADAIPAFINDNPELTEDWKIAYDARGNLVEPHTGRTVGLGTIAVGEYLAAGHGVTYNVPSSSLLNVDPQERFNGILFVEKEGFTQLITESGILERFDLALASTKGMSVVAARALIDDMAGRSSGFRLFTLTDFDITGVTIAETLIGSNHRYQYANRIRHDHLGVTWPQARKLAAAGLSEPSGRDNAESFRDTLADKLPPDAVDFLTTADETGLRVELNALKPRELLESIESQLECAGLQKVIPHDNLDEHYRELCIRTKLRAVERSLRAEKSQMPTDVPIRLYRRLAARPDLSWDEALAEMIAGESVDQGQTSSPTCPGDDGEMIAGGSIDQGQTSSPNAGGTD